MTRIELRGVTKIYPGTVPVRALDDVSLSIEDGEFVAITGASGSGKSTLLNVLALLDAPTAGTCLIDGQETSSSESARVRLRSMDFAFVFQAFHLLDSRPVIDSVELGLLYRGLPGKERRVRALEALTQVGLADKAGQAAGKLSGGERQRVAIARALACGAPVIVADEPTGNLDSANTAQVCAILQAIHSQGRTVVLVTHEAAVADLAQRRIAMADGRVVSDSQGTAAPASPGLPAVGVERPAPPGRASRLRLGDLIRDAVSSMISRRGRSAALAAAVAVGVGLGVATAGLAQTTSAQVSDAFDATLNRQVSVQTSGEQTQAELASMTSPQTAHRIADLAGVTHCGVVLSIAGQAAARSATTSPQDSTLLLASTDTAAAAGWRIRWLTPARPPQDTMHPGDVVVGRQMATRLNLGPLIAGPVVWVNGQPKAISGILESAGQGSDALNSIIYPMPAEGTDTMATYLTAYFHVVPGAARQVANQAPLALLPTDPGSLTVSAPPDPATFRNQLESQLRLMLVVLTAVVALAAFIALANSMVMGVSQRSGELGLRRAIGARPIHISALIVTESAVLGAIGATCGAALGVSALLTITIINKWQPILDPTTTLAAILAGIAVGSLSGLIATLRAVRIQPSDALRTQ